MEQRAKRSQSSKQVLARHDNVEDGAVAKPRKARRARLTQNACARCRQRKSKCDGQRPTCGRCDKDGEICAYNVSENMTRMQDLHSQLDRTSEECTNYLSLLDALRSEPMEVALGLLMHLRQGASVEEVVATIPPNVEVEDDLFDPSPHVGPAYPLYPHASAFVPQAHPLQAAHQATGLGNSAPQFQYSFGQHVEDQTASFHRLYGA